MTLTVKTFRIISLLFIIEMILLSVGLRFDVISFGIEVQAAMTELFIMLGLILSIITFFALKTHETKTKKMLVCLTGFIMLIMGLAFVLDDGFRIST
jgi:hypothetical protein